MIDPATAVALIQAQKGDPSKFKIRHKGFIHPALAGISHARCNSGHFPSPLQQRAFLFSAIAASTCYLPPPSRRTFAPK